jgi:iron complex transport system ATP-binding protein
MAAADAAAVIACDGLDVAVASRRLVRGLTLSVGTGQFVAVLGRNGAGKTLTLHTLAGLRPVAHGSVQVGGRELAAWPRRELARRLALLPQSIEDAFPSTVLDTALIGRHPHLDFLQWEGPDDRQRALDALAAVDLADLAGREVGTLSGGERRRLAVATVLTQDAALNLLDEPTNHLDPHHQLDVLALFRARADRGGTVIATLHDATLAARFADSVLLLFGDGEWSYGPTSEVLSATALSRLYRTEVTELGLRGRRIFATG